LSVNNSIASDREAGATDLLGVQHVKQIVFNPPVEHRV